MSEDLRHDLRIRSAATDYTLSPLHDGRSELDVVETIVARFPDFDQNRTIVLGQLVLGGATIVMLVTSCDLHLNVSPILVPVMGFAMVALIVCAALSIRPLHPRSKGAEAREFLERMRALEVRVQSLPEQPDWFVGSDGFNAVMFASTVRSFSTAMTTPLNTSSWTGTGGVRSRAARSAADSPVGGGGR